MDRLYCFGESGNSYKVALMLTLCEIPWEPVFVDFFKGEARTEAFRTQVNVMGEVPVLHRGDERLTQTGVILNRLARETGRFAPESDADWEECWRWILFDNQKFTGYIAPYRFLRCFAPKPVEAAVLKFVLGRAMAAYDIADKHLSTRDFILGSRPTIADLSLAGYIFYPPDETGLDLSASHPALHRWRERLRALPGWRGPYDLMPRAMQPDR